MLKSCLNRLCFFDYYAISSSRKFLSSTSLKKTPLYDFHVRNGGKMVAFAGWSMPVQYKAGIKESHVHVREHAGLFDVSHMLQLRIYGRDRVKFIESLVVSDIDSLRTNQGCLTVFTNPNGGILDDLIVTKTNKDYLFVVSNDGCADKDLENLRRQEKIFKSQKYDINLEVLNNSLLALQGPEMVKALQPGLSFHISELPFMRTVETSLYGIDNCRITRCGYTGEDGVEISVTKDRAEELAEKLLSCKTAQVQLTGLGARDSLRLEAGLCLYGHDIDETTTPVEAGLSWTIGKRRRELRDFPGADVILKQLRDKPARKRVGITSDGPPPREGAIVLDSSGSREIGKVTSGCPSPTLGCNIALAYVPLSDSRSGTKVKLKVRNNTVNGEVTRLPFVKTKYFILNS